MSIIDQYGTPAIMPGRTASVAAPKLSCGNAMAYAQVARSTQLAKISLDTVIGGEDNDLTLSDTLRDDSPTIESIIIQKELLEALYEELDRLDPEGKRICELMMYHSERESAEIMGMARSTFKRHWEKIRDELRNKLKDYYF